MLPNTKYKLTKVALKNEDSRAVQEGDVLVGFPKLGLERFHMDLDNGLVLTTSNIIGFTDNGNENYVIETLNSVYTLELASE